MDTQTTTAQSPADRAQTVGHDSKQAAQDVAATAGEEAKRTTREAKDQARALWSQTRSDLTDQASVQQSRAASGLRELAEQLGSMARAADRDGPARGLVQDVAQRADDAASWLDARDPGSLLQETRDFARRRPGTFLAVAAGLGVVAGRLGRSLVDEARDSQDSTGSGSAAASGQQFGDVGSAGFGTTADGHGTGTPAVTDSPGDTAMPAAMSPSGSTTASTPITAGAAPAAVSTVPSGDLPGAHRTTQPLMPDGSLSPIDAEGHLTAKGDDALRGER